MPDYRRFRGPGGTYFFTINLLESRVARVGRNHEWVPPNRWRLPNDLPPEAFYISLSCAGQGNHG